MKFELFGLEKSQETTKIISRVFNTCNSSPILFFVPETLNPPLKDELISSFGMLFQMFQLLVQSLVLNVVPFVFPSLFSLSK